MSFSCPDSLTVANASGVLQAGLAAVAHGETEFDLAALQKLDSAAVATLLAWQRAAHAAGRRLQWLHLPENLLSLLQMYGVAELLLPPSQA